MIFPKWIDKGDSIGVTACSGGKTSAVDLIRLDNAAKQFQRRGYDVVETPDVRTEEKGRSAPAKIRAEELHALVNDPKVSWVIQACGGDYLAEMLSYTDFEAIKANPKWYQGYSDPTGLLFTITTNCDMATVYAGNYGDFGMKNWHLCLEENVALLEGKELVQRSFPLYKNGFAERITGEEDYEEDTPVRWECAEDKVEISGRLLGGCLDVLLDLVGTRFDKTAEWCERYKEDGILWYLESFALSSERLTCGLWHLKEAGWFKYAKGFVFGRPTFFSSDYGIPYKEAVEASLGDLGLPIVYEADVGHKAPRMTMINGAKATIVVEDGKGSMTMTK
ncbi:MAG: LD-carboxypeptidase [Lachnospiraceae bacterium]|nr:LD-carboxypeptidase [Lachnospiraceae bacterium]